ncbi:hypothetical protein [Pseudomonas yangonensis]|uniref:hypothetical protein n=1 Tax=Pseudomonas yangonensis TaxID=2579922 RepID=UPI00137B9172|nr:hypothetical protein [Pseudomonas yangonensis]
MSPLPKRELIDQSISNIFKLLVDIGQSPGDYTDNEKVLNALKSQGGLCSLDIEFFIQDESFTIHPISLNTLKKRLADNEPNKDFQHLEKLRAHAQNAISKLSKELTPPNKRTRSALEDQVEELKASISTLQAVNMVLIQALEINRKDLITISDTTNTGLRQKRINDAINRIIKILGLNPAPFDDVTVLSMKNHLQLVPNGKANH